MILKNFHDYMRCQSRMAGVRNYNPATSWTACEMKNLSGVVRPYLWSGYRTGYIAGGDGYMTAWNNFCGLFNGLSFVCGTDDTAEDISDYQLGAVSNDFSIVSQQVTVALSENNKFVLTYVVTLTNTTASSVTIKEIGLTKRLAYSDTNDTSKSTYSDSWLDYFLIVREVLASPVTVPANATRTITFAIEYT